MHTPTVLGLGLAALLSVASISCGGSALTAGDAGVGASDGSANTDGTVSGTPLPCDVNEVVVNKCQLCHSNPTQGGAPMPLVTWEDFHAPTLADTIEMPIAGALVYQTAEVRIHDTANPMPQPPTTLTAAETATLDAWFNAGAPKTDSATCDGTDAGDASVSAPDAAPPMITCAPDQQAVALAPASAWTMPQDEEDQYVCYSVNLPPFGDASSDHVLAISPNIDNHTIVHHVLLFQADPNDNTITSTPAPCNAGGSLTWRVVYAWAPGGGAMQTPPNVGFPYDATTKWVVQVHYNNIKGLSGETDTSGFSFCATDQAVQYDADVVAFGNMDFQIPPLSTYDSTCNYAVTPQLAGIHAFAAFPHMHQLGQAIQTEQTLADGGIIGMAESVPWNFNSQIWFPIDTVLNAGDTVTTRCAWQNSTPQPVTFGQNTEDEMCYSFTAYYPKVTAGGWSWALPASASNPSTCQTSTDGGLPLLPTPSAGWSSGPGFGPDAGE
jgi:hypothetical protein